MNTNYPDTIARAFVDEIEFHSVRESVAELVLRITGTFGGGIAVTALLAALVHH